VTLKAVSVPAGGSPYLNANDDGTSIGLWQLAGNRERWVITEVGAYVTIGIDVNMTTRVYLGSNPDGTVLTLWKEVTADQQWVITDAGDYITIQKNVAAAGARKYLSVALGAVRLWSSAGAEEQWTFNCTLPPAPPPVCFGYFAGQHLPGCVSGETASGAACPDKGSMAAAKAACIAAGAACGGLVFEGTWQIRAGSLTSGSGDHAYPMGNSYCTTPCWGDVDGKYLPGHVVGDGGADHGSLAAAQTACTAKGTLCGGVTQSAGAWTIRLGTSKDLGGTANEHSYPKTPNWDHANAYCTAPPPPPTVCWGYSKGKFLAGCVTGDSCTAHGSMGAAKAACIAAGVACGGLTWDTYSWQIRAGSTPISGGTSNHAYPKGDSYCSCWGDVAGHYLPDYVIGGVDGYDFGSLAAAKTACIAKGALCGGVLHAESGAWQIRSKTSKDLVAYGPEHAYPKNPNWYYAGSYCS